MAELTKDAIFEALARGYCHEGNENKELDAQLLLAQAEEVLDLIDLLAEPAEIPIGSRHATSTEVRILAYDFALKSGKFSDQAHLHELAEAIEKNILHGFADTRGLDQQIGHILREADRVDWRREAWNDLKAVMTRVINRQIHQPRRDSYVLKLKKNQLENVRQFVDSFHFDANKP